MTCSKIVCTMGSVTLRRVLRMTRLCVRVRTFCKLGVDVTHLCTVLELMFISFAVFLNDMVSKYIRIASTRKSVEYILQYYRPTTFFAGV